MYRHMTGQLVNIMLLQLLLLWRHGNYCATSGDISVHYIMMLTGFLTQLIKWTITASDMRSFWLDREAAAHTAGTEHPLIMANSFSYKKALADNQDGSSEFFWGQLVCAATS